MTTYQSGADAMRAYAWSRVQDAEQALDAHRRDGTGCCVSCGRPTPCAAEREAGELHEHYRAWLNGARSDVQGGHLSARIRPYVLAVSGRAGQQAQ